MSVTDREIRAKLGAETVDSDLVDYLETRAGTDLRCVVEYDETGWDVQYAREDVRREEFERVLEEMEIRVRAAARRSDSSTDSIPRVAVSCYGTISVLHVPRDGSRNVAVLFDADATPRIRAFAEACRDRLAG